MKNFKKMFYLLVAFALALTVITGCGSGDSSVGNDTATGQGESVAIAGNGENETKASNKTEKESEGSESTGNADDKATIGDTGNSSENTEGVTSVVPDNEAVIPSGSNKENGSSSGGTGGTQQKETTVAENIRPQETVTKVPGTTVQQTTTAASSESSSAEKKAKAIVDTIIKSGMSEFDKALAIHDWMVFNLDYDFTYSIYNIEETLDKRKAVCDGYAKTYMMMCNLTGLDCVRITGTATNSAGSTGAHAWNQVKINGVWYNVDVTWDDPASQGKDPNDHSGNRYDYFLVSNSTLNKNHTPYAYETPYSCSSDYDKKTVLKAAANNGYYKNVGFAETQEDVNSIIKKCVEAGYSEFYVWYYDTALLNADMWKKLKELINNSPYPVSAGSSYAPSNGVTRYLLKADVNISEWNSLPIAKNAEEFANICNAKFDAGELSFKVRYEPTDGKFTRSGIKTLASYNKNLYGNGNALFTVKKYES